MFRWWSNEELDYLREHYPLHTISELVPMFNERFSANVTLNQLKGTLSRHKILSGRNGRFEKGQIPFNKGMKGINFGGENGKKTQFKKGQMPLNYKPVGTERVNVDGYTEVKIADPNKWRLKHLYIWEQVHGPLPKGHCLLFLDGNNLNVTLDNLQLISRNQLLRLNQNDLISNNPEVTKTGLIVADILCKIGERNKRRNNQ
jgi:hypothetical protein